MSKLRIAALCVSLLSSLTAHAEVIRFDVLHPADPRNAIIADIDKAPRDEKGLVEATTDVVLLRAAAVRAAAARMVAERLLLPEDAERAIELATQDGLSQLH